MKISKIVSLFCTACLTLITSCNDNTNLCSKNSFNSNQENKETTSSNKESKELDYCYFGDQVEVEKPRYNYFISDNLVKLKTVKISETKTINFKINFKFNIAAAEWEKNPINYYFSFQSLSYNQFIAI